MTEDESKEGISFGDTVPAASETVTEFTAVDAGTIESVQVRIYPGAELDLRITPELERHSGGTPQPLITTEGKGYIDGDDDVWTWDISKPINRKDIIRIRAENVNANYDYDYRCNVDVDYKGGLRRAINGVLP